MSRNSRTRSAPQSQGWNFSFSGSRDHLGWLGWVWTEVGTRSGPGRDRWVWRVKNVVLDCSSIRHPVRQVVSAHPASYYTRRRFDRFEEVEAEFAHTDFATRVISVLGLKGTSKIADPTLFCRQRTASRRERLAVSAFRRRRGGGGGGGSGLPAPLLAPRALILLSNQRLDALSRLTPPYFGHP